MVTTSSSVEQLRVQRIAGGSGSGLGENFYQYRFSCESSPRTPEKVIGLHQII